MEYNQRIICSAWTLSLAAISGKQVFFRFSRIVNEITLEIIVTFARNKFDVFVEFFGFRKYIFLIRLMINEKALCHVLWTIIE